MSKEYKKEKMCTDALIDSLCGDLDHVCCLKHPAKRFINFLIFLTLYLVISISIIGIRGDIMLRLLDFTFSFEILLILSMSIFAALSSIWLCIPDMRQQKWLLAVTLTLFSTFTAWTILRMSLDSFVMPDHHWHACYLVSIIFGAIPALVIFVASIKGKTTHPLLLSAMNTLSIGGAGYIGLRLVCTSDDIGHICIFHILPYILFAFIASIIGRKIYCW